MQKMAVSRNDDIYEANADIAQAADGTLICTYRESMVHEPRPWSKVIVRRSHDRGLTWGPRQIVIERTREQSRAREGRLNCSRVTACRDGILLLIVDLLFCETGELETKDVRNLLFRSHDHGATWDGPEETGMTGAIVPSIKELSNGNLVVGLTEHGIGDDGESLTEAQTTYVSGDRGNTWEGPFRVANPPTPPPTGKYWRLNEGDFAELDDGALILYARGRRAAEWLEKSIARWRTHLVGTGADSDDALPRPAFGRPVAFGGDPHHLPDKLWPLQRAGTAYGDA